MKRITILGTIFILLAVLVVPAMAKSPHNNGGQGNTGNGSVPVTSSGGSSEGQDNQHGNSGKSHGNRHNDHGNGGNKNQNGSHMSNPFYLQGTIKSIDSANKTITVTLVHGNAKVKQFIGGDLTLQVTDATQIFKINQTDEDGDENSESSTPTTSSSTPNTSNTTNENDGDEGSNRVPITFEQLAVGDIVAIHGYLVDGVYTARLITVYVRTPEGETSGG